MCSIEHEYLIGELCGHDLSQNQNEPSPNADKKIAIDIGAVACTQHIAYSSTDLNHRLLL
jgi:hypothetical protein